MGEASELKGSPQGIWPISLEKSKMSANTELQQEHVTHAQSSTAAVMATGTHRVGKKKYDRNCASGQQLQEKIMFLQGSIPCSITETWRTAKTKWLNVKGDRTEQHREVVPGRTTR